MPVMSVASLNASSVLRQAIAKVNASMDCGRTWHVALRQEPILQKCHTRFQLPRRWDARRPFCSPAARMKRDSTAHTTGSR
jgi:sulfane dehydrogenase subunit SoxC